MLAALVALAAALAAALCVWSAGGGGAAGQTGPPRDVWSGTWSVSFRTSQPASGQAVDVPGSLLDVVPISEAEGRALTSQGGSVFFDPVCSTPSEPTLYYKATTDVEFVSGVHGVVPGPNRPTAGATLVFCTTGDENHIRGNYKNDIGAEDAFIGQPVANGSLLATKSGPAFEGSLTREPGDRPGAAFHTAWRGRCQSGACALAQRRTRLKVVTLSRGSLLNCLLTRGRGTGLVLEKTDGTRRKLLSGQEIDLEDGDVVTAARHRGGDRAEAAGRHVGANPPRPPSATSPPGPTPGSSSIGAARSWPAPSAASRWTPVSSGPATKSTASRPQAGPRPRSREDESSSSSTRPGAG